MAAGDLTPGRRVDDKPPWDFEPGDYGVRVQALEGRAARTAWISPGEPDPEIVIELGFTF